MRIGVLMPELPVVVSYFKELRLQAQKHNEPQSRNVGRPRLVDTQNKLSGCVNYSSIHCLK